MFRRHTSPNGELAYVTPTYIEPQHRSTEIHDTYLDFTSDIFTNTRLEILPSIQRQTLKHTSRPHTDVLTTISMFTAVSWWPHKDLIGNFWWQLLKQYRWAKNMQYFHKFVTRGIIMQKTVPYIKMVRSLSGAKPVTLLKLQTYSKQGSEHFDIRNTFLRHHMQHLQT